MRGPQDCIRWYPLSGTEQRGSFQVTCTEMPSVEWHSAGGAPFAVLRGQPCRVAKPMLSRAGTPARHVTVRVSLVALLPVRLFLGTWARRRRQRILPAFSCTLGDFGVDRGSVGVRERCRSGEKYAFPDLRKDDLGYRNGHLHLKPGFIYIGQCRDL